MSEARITNLSNESNTGGPTISGITTFSGTNYFVPPVGNTAQRPENPEKGSIRFNTDTAHLEYYRGDAIGWVEVEASNEELNGGIRAICMGGSDGPALGDNKDVIDYFNVDIPGNAIDFGDLTEGMYGGAGLADRTRSVVAGDAGSPAYKNTIEYVTISSTGNSQDFGDIAAPNIQMTAFASSTRGVVAGGYEHPAYTDRMQYVTIQTTGNTVDFGNLTAGTGYLYGGASTTRGITAGGDAPTTVNTIEYITISSTGNASNFGDLLTLRWSGSGCSNSTRMLIAGGRIAPSPSGSNTIEYITIATLGNAIDFGDLDRTADYACTSFVSSPTRGVFAAGRYSPLTNRMDMVTIATTGNAVDWGDTTIQRYGSACSSNGHGGL